MSKKLQDSVQQKGAKRQQEENILERLLNGEIDINSLEDVNLKDKASLKQKLNASQENLQKNGVKQQTAKNNSKNTQETSNWIDEDDLKQLLDDYTSNELKEEIQNKQESKSNHAINNVQTKGKNSIVKDQIQEKTIQKNQSEKLHNHQSEEKFKTQFPDIKGNWGNQIYKRSSMLDELHDIDSLVEEELSRNQSQCSDDTDSLNQSQGIQQFNDQIKDFGGDFIGEIDGKSYQVLGINSVTGKPGPMKIQITSTSSNQQVNRDRSYNSENQNDNNRNQNENDNSSYQPQRLNFFNGQSIIRESNSRGNGGTQGLDGFRQFPSTLKGSGLFSAAQMRRSSLEFENSDISLKQRSEVGTGGDISSDTPNLGQIQIQRNNGPPADANLFKDLFQTQESMSSDQLQETEESQNENQKQSSSQTLTKTRSKKSLPTKFNSSYQRDNQGKKSSPSEDKQK